MMFDEVLNLAAKDLPEGYVIEICVEKGSGWVDLYGPGYSDLGLDCTYEGIEADVKLAIHVAKEHAGEAVSRG